jgi:molybdopterin-guanine dinucleotide biosynthesis protein A
MIQQVEAFILAGGASRRMGTDKARLSLDGKLFIERIAEILHSVASRVVVVGHNFEDLGLRSISDIHPQWGALGGIHTALTNAHAEWALVTACDLPFVTSALFERLFKLRDKHEAVVPVQPDLIPQPLCAFYEVTPCLEHTIDLIDEGRRRPLDLLERVNTKWVNFVEVEDLPGAEKFFVNINTPEDYYDARQKGVAGD